MGSQLITLGNFTSIDWQLCFSSFQDDVSSPSAFHRHCDMYNSTLVIVRNSLGFTFGGYVRCTACGEEPRQHFHFVVPPNASHHDCCFAG